MTFDPTKWREIPGKPCYYEYIGPQRVPDMEKVRQMIRDALAASTPSPRPPE